MGDDWYLRELALACAPMEWWMAIICLDDTNNGDDRYLREAELAKAFASMALPGGGGYHVFDDTTRNGMTTGN